MSLEAKISAKKASISREKKAISKDKAGSRRANSQLRRDRELAKKLKAEVERDEERTERLKRKGEKEKAAAEYASQKAKADAQEVSADKDKLKAVTSATSRQKRKLAAKLAQRKKLQGQYAAAKTKNQAEKGKLSIQKSRLQATERELTNSDKQLKRDMQKENSATAEQNAKLGKEGKELNSLIAKVDGLRASEQSARKDVSELGKKEKKLKSEAESDTASTDKLKEKTQQLQAKADVGVKHQLDRSTSALRREDAKLKKDKQAQQAVQKQNRDTKVALLKESLRGKAEASELKKAQQALSDANKNVGQLEGNVQKQKLQLSEINGRTQGLKAQVKDENGLAKSLDKSSAGAKYKTKARQLGQLMKKDKRALNAEQEASTQGKKAEAMLQAKTEGLGGQIEDSKAQMSDSKEKLSEMKKNLSDQQKKHQVLKKVLGSWEHSLKASQAALDKQDTEMDAVKQRIGKQKQKAKAAIRLETKAKDRKQADTREWSHLLKAASEHLNVAHQNKQKVEAGAARDQSKLKLIEAKIAHQKIELTNLRQRKRKLVQSKLDALEKKEAPFHAPALKEMNDIAKANALQAESMQATQKSIDKKPKSLS